MVKSIDKGPRMLSAINRLNNNADWIGIDQYGNLKIEHEGLEANLSSIALPVEAAALIAGTIGSLTEMAGLNDTTPKGLGKPKDLRNLAGGGAAGMLMALLGMDEHREAGLGAAAEYTIQAQTWTRLGWKYLEAVYNDLPLDENMWASAFLPIKIRKDKRYRANQRVKIGNALVREINYEIRRTNNPDKIRQLQEMQGKVLEAVNLSLQEFGN